MATSRERLSSREKRRVDAKRAIQSAALDMFEQAGFAPVTMEQIAEAAGVGVATLYRYFGTKEQVVLWDEYDPLLFAQITEHLGRSSALEAAQAAIRESLEEFYAADAQRILRRARLIAKNPALHVAVLDNLAQLRAGLVQALTRRKAALTKFEAEVAAGVVVACLQAAIDAWVRARGRQKLGKVIDSAFQSLRSLSQYTKARR
jgi:AcrR family transcriptional regulator